MDAKSILNISNIKVTKNRVLLLDRIINTGKALSLGDLHQHLKNEMDRATVYRGLKFLVEKNILSQISNSKGIQLFALKGDPALDSKARFKCNTCDSVDVLPELPPNYVDALSKMSIKDLNVTIEGTCGKCNDETE